MQVFIKTVTVLIDIPDLGDRIRKARECKGLTRQQLGKECGVLRTNIWSIERGTYGRGRITLDLVRSIERALDTQLILDSELQEGDQLPNKET